MTRFLAISSDTVFTLSCESLPDLCLVACKFEQQHFLLILTIILRRCNITKFHLLVTHSSFSIVIDSECTMNESCNHYSMLIVVCFVHPTFLFSKNGSSCGRVDSVMDSHTTGPGFKTRLVRYFLPSYRLTTITAS